MKAWTHWTRRSPTNSYEIEVEKLEDIQDVVVTTHDNMPVYVKQIAKVVIGYQPRLGVVGRNGENDVVEGIVLMRKYEKSLPTSEKVKEKIDHLNTSGLLPKGMHIRIFNQRTELVNVTKHNVIHNLLVGMGLVILILFVFLGDISSAGIVAVMIPLALLFSVSVLVHSREVGQPSVDRCCRFRNHRRQFGHHRRERVPAHHGQECRPDAALDRPDHRRVTRDRTRPLFLDADHRVRVHSTIFDDGTGRGALRPDGEHLCLCDLRRAVLAVTLTPVLCSYLFQNKKEEKETFIDRIMKLRYLIMLNRVLNHRYLLLAAMGSLLVFTITLIPKLGGEFMPPLEEGNLWIRALLPRTVTSSGGGADGSAPSRRDLLNPGNQGSNVACRPP